VDAEAMNKIDKLKRKMVLSQILEVMIMADVTARFRGLHRRRPMRSTPPAQLSKVIAAHK
jgi:hypothetical protein